MARDSRTRDNASNPEETKRLCEAVCLVKTPEEAVAFLADLLSPHEMCDLAQRLEVATLLRSGRSYVDVSSTTGASSTTVSRVSKCLRGERGGYRLVLERLDGAADAAEHAGIEKDWDSEKQGDKG
ncbi:TrpR-related protein YerC/YecD [Olsenella sp. KH3B4]|jgi:TrpR-related protein YerC/YecD|uniref:YerC/YecD family TrpR-related protein n=1 Tax=Olsenella sp. KH3B4 TaxID=1855394 RepID=UPI0008D39752|nr:YerC/YecD family TrpR-related protein [Olsenella sp. KH3B4]SES64964.1 TrpR-related protein YerC/YecD [Olsenella sp. KH3B4]